MIKLKTILKYYVSKRIIAFYLDGLIFTSLALGYLFLFDENGPFIVKNNQFYWNSNIIWIYQIIFYILYFLFTEYIFNCTLGKFFLGYKVFDKNKRFLNILLRTLIRLIPINLISFLFDNHNLFWHEKWSNIYTKKK